MKIERIQSPMEGANIPVLRRADGQGSESGRYVGSADADTQKRNKGEHYPPRGRFKSSESDTTPKDPTKELQAVTDTERTLDITV